jgi:hypothetical protein
MKFQPTFSLPRALQDARVLCVAIMCSAAFAAIADDSAALPAHKAPDNAVLVCAPAESYCSRTDLHTALTNPAASAHAAGPVRFNSDSTLAGAHVRPDFKFQDDDVLLRRLADMRSLPVMTLWQSRRAQIFFGVDRKGLAGLHIRQRREPAEQSTLWRSPVDNRGTASTASASSATPRSVAP